ncbi:MAG: hypothetical protein AAGA56_23275 [Myxococcota bacterium]
MHFGRLAAVWALLAALALAGSASGQEGAPEKEVVITEKARALFRTGVAKLEDPDGAKYAEAYSAFKAAYAESPSPKILYNLGLSAMKLERDGEAIEAFDGYLTRSKEVPPQLRRQVENDLQTLRTTLVPIKLTIAPVGATVIDTRQPVGGTPVVNRYGPTTEETLVAGVKAGSHKIQIQRDGYVTETLRLELTPGATLEKKIELKKEPPRGGGGIVGPKKDTVTERPVPLSVWIGLGATAAVGIGAGVVGGLALSKGSEYDDANTGADPLNAEGIREEAATLNIVTDVLLGATVVGAGVTAVLFFTRPEVEVAADRGADEARSGRWDVGGFAGPQGGVLTVKRTF